MGNVIEARGLSKRYGRTMAVNNIDLQVPAGRIVGLIGPNGAGKTSALKAILGLATYDGHLSVLGKDPASERAALMEDVCFIADVAVLPRWIRVREAIEVVERERFVVLDTTSVLSRHCTVLVTLRPFRRAPCARRHVVP